MIFQTAMTADLAEAVFRAVKSSFTVTDTGATLQAGEAVIFATATASDNGHYVQRPASSTAIINNLYVGNVHAEIVHEGVGLVQCYGLDTDARLEASLTAIAGQLLVPQLNSTATQITGRGCLKTNVSPQFAAVATGVVTDQFQANGAAGLAVVMEAATAGTSTGGAGTVKAFIRAL